MSTSFTENIRTKIPNKQANIAKKKEGSNYPNPFKAGRISNKNQTKPKIEKTETGIGNNK